MTCRSRSFDLDPFHWAERPVARSRSSRRRRQVADAHEVINRRRKGEHPSHARHPAMAGLPHETHGLQPSEDLFDPLALFLTLGVSGVARCPVINGAACVLESM